MKKRKKSAIKLNSLWKEVKPSVEFKKFYKRTTGLDAKRLLLPKKKYYDLLNRLLVSG